MTMQKKIDTCITIQPHFLFYTCQVFINNDLYLFTKRHPPLIFRLFDSFIYQPRDTPTVLQFILLKSTNIPYIQKPYLKKLRQENLKLNFDKCLFFQTEINLFGHIISDNLIKMNQKNINLKKVLPIPKNTSELSRFFSCTG